MGKDLRNNRQTPVTIYISGFGMYIANFGMYISNFEIYIPKPAIKNNTSIGNKESRCK